VFSVTVHLAVKEWATPGVSVNVSIPWDSVLRRSPITRITTCTKNYDHRIDAGNVFS